MKIRHFLAAGAVLLATIPSVEARDRTAIHGGVGYCLGAYQVASNVYEALAEGAEGDKKILAQKVLDKVSVSFSVLSKRVAFKEKETNDAIVAEFKASYTEVKDAVLAKGSKISLIDLIAECDVLLGIGR